MKELMITIVNKVFTFPLDPDRRMIFFSFPPR
jgi:hypothetical protein